MKKFNRVSNRWIMFGILLPMIVFLLCLSVVYALFSSTSRTIASAGQSTAAIKVGFTSGTTLNNTQISNANGAITDLLPGDDIQISGSVINNGNYAFYYIINFKLTITVNNSTEVLVNDNYTIESNEIVSLDSTNTDAALLSEYGDTQAFTLTHTLDPTYGNTYQGATINYKLTAFAVQTYSFTATTAAEYLATLTSN